MNEIVALQEIVDPKGLLPVGEIVIPFTPEDTELLKRSGLAVFDEEGKLSSVSTLAAFAGNYFNFSEGDNPEEELASRESIRRLAERIEGNIFAPESLLDKALRGA